MSRFEIERLRNNAVFEELAAPVSLETVIKDAEFFIRYDGLVVNAEGWFHPPQFLIGEVLYTPDAEGDKIVFGERYRKVTLSPGTLNPVPYRERARILTEIDPSLDQTQANPFFAIYKQILPRSQFIAHLPSEKAFTQVVKKMAVEGDGILKDIENMQIILGIDLSRMTVGLTGGALLGDFKGYHDLDLVFRGSVEENLELSMRMRDLVRDDKKRRLFEGGKGWNIRFFNDHGTIMCNFFGYQHPKEAPLSVFNMELIEEGVTVEGVVADDRHTIYTPTVLGLSDVFFTRIKGKTQKSRAPDNIPVIIYHTATRGDCFKGDRIRVQGSLVNVTTPEKSYQAICVIEREGVRNLTPSWDGYYAA